MIEFPKVFFLGFVVKIQLAIQGGGAKLASILAVLEAVEELEKDGKIEITRLAGTSAGAIASCLYATNQPISFYRQRLRDLGVARLNEVVPTQSKWTVYWRLFRGKAIYDIRNIRQFFADLLDAEQPRFKDLKKPVLMIAADILNEEKRVYGEDENGRVIDSLVDSCALPFVFKSVSEIGTACIVDGGICDNLPSDELDRIEELGPVIGISFTRDTLPQPPENLKELSLSLIETAISNSVKRAREKIGEDRIFSIETSLNTLDFARALEYGLQDDHYMRVKLQAEKWFNNLITGPAPSGSKDELGEIMNHLWQVFEAHHKDVEVHLDQLSMIVTAHSLDGENLQPDHVIMEMKLRPIHEPIQCRHTKVHSADSEGFNSRSSWRVNSAKGEVHKVIPVPISRDRRTQNMLLFFVPPLPVGIEDHEPYTISHGCNVAGGMTPLKNEGKDRLTLKNANKNPFSRADIVMYVPDDTPPVKMTALPDTEGKTTPGRMMEPTELARDHRNAPAGYRAIGWTTTQQLEGKKRFGVKFEIEDWLVARG